MPRLNRLFILFLFAALIIGTIQSQQTAPSGLSGTLNDQLLIDVDGDGLVDPGDTLRYTLNVTNCGPNSANNAVFSADLDPFTSLLPASQRIGAPSPASNCPPIEQAAPATEEVAPPPPLGPEPSVTTTTPADNATEVAFNSNLDITFSEAVTVTGDWFQMVCSSSGTFNLSSANIAVTGGPTTYTLDPSLDLQVGETCTVTVTAAAISDVDNLTPLADYVFDFLTETPPIITATNPTDGEPAAVNSADIVVTFDEPVTVTNASFTLTCGGPAIAFVESGSGTNTITLNPSGNLPSGTACTVLAVAANISDVDANDPPDLLDGNNDGTEGDNDSFSFTVAADAAPTVQTISPANLAVSVPTNTTIEVTFSESVDIASAAAFSLECPSGTPQGFTVTSPAVLPASATTFIITPAALLPAGEICTVRVFEAAVTDTDLDEPPDNMAADFSSTFTTEAPPSVTGTSPTNGATNVPTNTDIVLTFSEAVNVSGPSFSMFCGVTPIITSNSGTGTNTITLDPVVNLPTNTLCTVTIVAAQVTDMDSIDPPDNMAADYVFSFTTLVDTAPTASSPLDGATDVPTSSNIVINFSEPVDVTSGAFTLECPIGTAITAFTVTPALNASNQTSFTLNPDASLPATSTCRVTVLAANVNDSDLDEPPNLMAANYQFTFDTLTDLAPTVNQAGIVPTSTSSVPNTASLTNPVSTTPTITIPFSEAIDAATGAITLDCAGPVGVTVTPGLPTTNQTSLDVSPSVALSPGAACTLTVVAANISDTDTEDPPNLMVANYTLTFTVDSAPAQVAPFAQTEVNNTFENIGGTGATNVDLDSDIRITFNEAVSVTFPANGLQCPAGNNIPVTVTTNNAATIVLNPNINLPLNTLCTLNIPAANISDVDTADNPDTPAAAVNHTFQTANDNAPTVTTIPANAAGSIAVNANITVTFNEPVTLTGTWFNLSCTISGNRSSAGELTGTGITIIENTPDLLYTIDPTVDFAAGDTCTITIDSANAVDNDVIDPPNELDGDANLDVVDGDADDYVAVFSTVDMAPQVGATAGTVPASHTVLLNFSEAVDIAAGAFTFECPPGSPITGGFNTSVPLPANAITAITLTPVNPLPFGTTCEVTVESTLVTDDDAIDPPNELDGDVSNDIFDGDADDFILSFVVDAQATEILTQVEVATVTTNIAGAVNVDLGTNIVVVFSEPVTVGLTSFDLECPAGSDIAFTVGGSGSNTIIIDPTPATLPINTLCDFDIIAANVTDSDAIDAPDVLDADVNYTFTTVNDNPPSVTNVAAEVSNTFTALPLGAGVYADADTDLRVTFNEAVTVAGNWAELNCTTSGIQNVSGGLGVTDADPVFTLNPGTNLTPGENCTLTVFAAQVTDDDAIDPPNFMLANAVFTFTVLDTPPQVNTGTSTPANGATVPNNQTVTINFTEMVDIAAGGITFTCNAVPVPFTPALPQNNLTGITLTPSAALTNGAACTVTLESTLITDDDTADAPDQLDGNASNDTTDGDADDFVLNFTVDTQPTVTSAEAQVSTVFTALSFTPPTYADANTNLRVTFSEAVNPTGNWASLNCAVSGIQSVGGGTLAVTAADPVFTLDPSTNLAGGENCTLTIVAAQVNDDDAIDPPANLPADAVYTFTVVDTAPQVTSFTPLAAATVPNNQAVTINFSEIVDVAASGITWQCGATNVTFTPALPQNNVTSLVLTPSITLPAGSCTVTLESTLITDDDAVDPPNQLDGNASNDTTDGDADDFTRSFTVDAEPAPFSVGVDVGGVPQFLPLGGGQFVDVGSDLRIVFTEPIDATVAGITLQCPAGSPVAFPGLPLTNTTNFTLNPSANLPGGTLCVLSFVDTGITDTDTFDPPDQVSSLNFLFTTQSTANDDAYTVTPHLTYVSPTGVRANDSPATTTVTGFGPTLGTANGTAPNGTNAITAGGAGGRVVMNADGTFTFYPDASDDNTDGVVTFFYTITGGDTAQVTLTFEAEEFVWFVDNTPSSTVCTGTNNGTQACPEDTLSDVAVADTNNDVIYIDSGNYTCGITLQNDEIVIGNGSSSTLAALTASRVTPVAGSSFAPYNALNGTAPILSAAAGDCFLLNANNTVRGLTVDNTPSGHAFQDDGATIGTATLAEVSFSGSGGIFNLANGGTLNATLGSMTSTSSPSAPILLTNMAGTITQTGGGTITHTGTFDLFDVNGGTVSASISAALSATGGNGSIVDVSGGHTGTLTFSGAITSSGTYAGDNLQFDNADGTYNFNGETDLLAGTAGVNIQNGSGGSFTTTDTNSSIANINGISFRVNASTMTINTALDITHTSQANRGVEIIIGTGTINFTGSLQIGTVGSPMLSAVGVFLDDTGAANAITFSDLNIITGTGGGAGSQAFVSQTSGRIAVTTGSIDCNGNIGADNHCFDVSNTTSSGVTFASFLSDHDDLGENGGSIFLNNTPGTFTFAIALRMTGNNAAIIQATNFGTLNVGTVSTANMETSNRPVWNIENGAININATNLRSTDSSTEGIRLVNTSGTGIATTGPIDINLSPASTFGILLQNITAGAYSFSPANTITMVDRPNEGIYLNNVDGGSVSFGNTTISNPGGTTEAAVRGENGSSSVTFAQANINQGNAGAGEAFTASLPQATTGAGDAVYLNTMTGGFTINGGTIQNAADDTLDVRNSSAVTINGATLIGRGTANCDGCFGVQILNGSGTYQLDNLTISDFQGNSGFSPTAPSAVWQGMDANNTLTLDIDNGTWTGNSAVGNNSTYGFGYQGYNQLGTVTVDIDNTNFNDIWNRGIQVTGNGTANLTTNVRNADFNGTGVGGYSGIELFTSGAHSGNLQFVIDNNTFTDTMDFAGFVIRLNLNDDTNAAFTNSISGNTITETVAAGSGAGVSILLEENVDLDVNINNNTITNLGSNAVAITTNAVWTAAGLLEFNMNNNTFGTAGNEVGQTGGALSRQAVLIRNEGSGTMNGRLDGSPSIRNTVAGVGATDGTVILRVSNAGIGNFTVNNLAVSSSGGNTSTLHAYAGATSTMCVNISNSTANGGVGEFKIQEIAGGTLTYTVAGNNPAAPTLVGAPTLGGACALPVVAAPSSTTVVEAPSFGAPSEVVVAEPSFLESLFNNIINLGASTVYAQAPSLNLALGTLPPNSQLSVTFDVVVGEVPANLDRLILHGVLSADGFTSTLTDDPQSSLLADATVTLLDPLHSVRELPSTGETPWWRDVLGMLMGALVLGWLVKGVFSRLGAKA